MPIGQRRDVFWMHRAIALATAAAADGEVPVGAVLVRNGVELAAGANAPITSCDPSAHAEIVALRKAARVLGNYRLTGTTLFCTLEPCPMCAGALIHARVARVVFGAHDPRWGAAGSLFNVLGTERLNHRIQVESGLLADDCAQLLAAFFAARRRTR